MNDEICKGDYVRYKGTGRFGCVKGFDENGNCVVLTIKGEYTLLKRKYVEPISDAKE